MKELRTDIIINASPEDIWKIFSDLRNYPRWSTFIQRIEGSMKKGEKMKLHLKTPKGQEMDIEPEVLVNDPGREFRWLGHFGGVNFLFNGEHYLKMEPIGNCETRFIQGEKFTGLLVPFLWKGLNTDTRAGFVGFNEALKRRVERLKGD